MEARRRFFGQPVQTFHFSQPQVKEDSDDEYLYDEKIWKVYDESDDEVSTQKYKRARIQKRKNFDTNATLIIVLLALVIVSYAMNIYSHRELRKLQADLGHDLKKHDPEVWWHKALVYYIHPRSFQDSDGDGIGDIKGIISRIGHLEYLRIQAVVLGCVLKASQEDPGRDILDYYQIDPEYGSLDDFKTLLNELHKKGIKLIFEIIPNQTSDRHKWFQESRKGDNEYRDYYVWHPGKKSKNGTRLPPSNWRSRYGGSAWEWDEVRGEYYLHQYGIRMPDLNHRDPLLLQQFKDVVSYWIETGIDGVRMEGVHAIFELNDVTLDEPLNDLLLTPVHPDEFDYLVHDYTDDQPEIHEFMAIWRELLEEYAVSQRTTKLFLNVDLEDDMIIDVIKYYETGADAPTNYFLTQISKDCDSRCIHDLVDSWLNEIPEAKTSLWALSSQEHGRMASRKDSLYARALAVLHLLLPGASLIYYGDEIGMYNVLMDTQNMVDIKYRYTNQVLYAKHSRDPYRTPMQWNAEKNAGFSTADHTWLPIHQDYKENNKELQFSDPDKLSMLHLYRKLALLREEPTFDHGKMKFASTNDLIFSFIRFSGGTSSYLISLNFGKLPATDDYCSHSGADVGQVVLYAPGLTELKNPELVEGKTINLESLTLYPGDALILKLYFTEK